MATSPFKQAIDNSILTTVTGAGLDSQTPLESAMTQMNALDLLNAYGASEANSILAQRSDAVNDFANLMGTSRTDIQATGDLLNSTTLFDKALDSSNCRTAINFACFIISRAVCSGKPNFINSV